MGATDDGDVYGSSPEPGPGGGAHGRAEAGALGNGNGHVPGDAGAPERSPWAAPAWDVESEHGGRPEPLAAVAPGNAGPEVGGAGRSAPEVGASEFAGPGPAAPEVGASELGGPGSGVPGFGGSGSGVPGFGGSGSGVPGFGGSGSGVAESADPLSAGPVSGGHGPAGPPVPEPSGGPGSPWGYPPPGPQPEPPVAAPARTHRWGLGAYVSVEAVFLLASVAVAAVLGDRLTSSAGALAIALVVPTVLAAGTAVLITWVRGNGPAVDLGLQWSWRDVGLGLAFGFGGLVITIPASILYLAIAGSDTTSAVGEEFSGVRSGPVLAAVVFVIVVFVAPLCEEIVYRGLLWGAVERLGAYRWWALGITTVVFALAHFELTRTPLLFVVAIPIGLARLYSGRLVASVVAHGVNNLLPAVSLVLMLLGVLPGT